MRFLRIPFFSALLGLAAIGSAQFGLNLDRRYDQNTILGTHNAYANPSDKYILASSNQEKSIEQQLKDGVRYINLDLWAVRQKKIALNYQSRIYKKDGTSRKTLAGPLGNQVNSADPSIVVGHNIYDLGYGLIEGGVIGGSDGTGGGGPHAFRTFAAKMEEIWDWLQDNPSAVVTLDFEDNIAHEFRYLYDRVMSGYQPYIFYPDSPDLNMPAPYGTGGWDVHQHGWPTYRQLTAAGKRFVLLPVGSYDHRVNTNYGNDSVCDDTWTNPRNSTPIGDLRRAVFLMEHDQDAPNGLCVGCEPYNTDPNLPTGLNHYGFIEERLNALKRKYTRIPQILLVDSFQKGGDGGPREIVRDLNAEWAAMGTVSALTPTVSPTPTMFGWNRTDVTVGGFAGTGTKFNPHSILYSVWGANTQSLQRVAPNSATYVATAEGTTYVSSSAVAGYGYRGSNVYKTIRIDKTKPIITHDPYREPNIYGWYNSDLTVTYQASDALSGIFADPQPKTLSEEGANQSIRQYVLDRAYNRSDDVITGIKLDKTKPVITYSNNLGVYTVDLFIDISCTPTDALSGVRIHTCEPIQSDAYKFALGTHSFSATARDFADNDGFGSTNFTVIVTGRSLANLTRRFVTHPGVGHSMAIKLEHAQAAEEAGNLNAKRGHINAFLNQLRAQTGKKITAENAAILEKLAKAL